MTEWVARSLTDACERAATLRVHIIGGPGGGKTTLSRRLGARLGLPVFEIDEIRERGGLGPNFRPLSPLVDRLIEVGHIARQPTWITEGSALWWTDELLKAADVIIWTDIPWRVALMHIVARHFQLYYLDDIRRQRQFRNRMHAIRHPRLQSLHEFISMARAYYREDAWRSIAPPEDVDEIRFLTRASTERHLAQYMHKVVRYERRAELTRAAQFGIPHGLLSHA
jgi:adenylate kinase family enzyme